jgi:hypothetical protein
MEERGDVGNLLVRQIGERRHSFGRPAGVDEGGKQISRLVVADQIGANQIRAAPSSCVGSMAEGARGGELCFAPCHSSGILGRNRPVTLMDRCVVFLWCG